MGLPRGLRKSKPSSTLQNKRIKIASTPIASSSTNSPPWFGDNSPIQSSPSPVHFLCTQDGSHGETDVIWSYYSPKSRKDHRNPNETPVRRRREIIPPTDFSPLSRIPTKRKSLRQAHTRKDFLKGLKEELIALNKHVQEATCAKVASEKNIKAEECSSPDMFSESLIQTAECIQNLNNNTPTSSRKIEPLKSYISDKIFKCENDGLESDDSMNEFLLRASEMVEENLEKKSIRNPVQKSNTVIPNRGNNSTLTKPELLNLNNDSFDNLISNINDSYIETLTQKCSFTSSDKEFEISHDVNKNVQFTNNHRAKNYKVDNVGSYNQRTAYPEIKNTVSWDSVKTEIHSSTNQLNNSFSNSPLNESKSKFSRHKSMPSCNTSQNVNKPTSSFGRHNSMPFSNKLSNENISDSFRDIKDEIKRKREAAREKLLSKKQSLSTITKMNTQISSQKIHTETIHETFNKNLKCDSLLDLSNRLNIKNDCLRSNKSSKDLHEEIERKRKEALEKLQKKKLNVYKKN